MDAADRMQSSGKKSKRRMPAKGPNEVGRQGMAETSEDVDRAGTMAILEMTSLSGPGNLSVL
jgi:hypothetical protein